MRQILLRPAGKPRFGRATVHPPWPSGTSRLSGLGCSCGPGSSATLMDESEGCSHPRAIEIKRAARGDVIAEVDLDVVIARNALILAAAEGIEVASVERAQDHRLHRFRGRRWRARWDAAFLSP